MKNTFVTLLILFTLTSYSQVFNKSSKNKEFIRLLSHGITYVNSGNDSLDNAIGEGLKKYWKVSDYKTINVNSAKSLTEDDIILYAGNFKTSIDGREAFEEHLLILIKVKYLIEGHVTKGNSIGYVVLNGFNQKMDASEVSIFYEYGIKGFDQSIALIKEKKVKGSGVSLDNYVSDLLCKNASTIKGKVLLIIGDTEKFIPKELLEQYELKYKYVSEEEYSSLMKDNQSRYCILYFSSKLYTDITVYDGESKEMIYNIHFLGGRKTMPSKEFKRMRKNMDK